MRNKLCEVSDFSEISNIVARCDTIRIAMFDEPYPYIVPVNFGEEIIGDQIISYIHTGYEGRNISLKSEIKNAAQTVGISAQQVDNALNDPRYAESLQKNMEDGWNYGINSVPVFIINDEYKVNGAQQPEVFAGIFEEILAGSKA